MTPSKKSEVITTITTTNISTTTTTVKKETEDGETVEVEKSTEESVDANGATGEENGKNAENKKQEVQAEPQSRGSTLKREGVTFDVTSTPSKSPLTSSSSVSCIKLISTCLSRCKQF